MKKLRESGRDCKFYDFGDTAPSAYGAFCKVDSTMTNAKRCSTCKKYEKKRRP